MILLSIGGIIVIPVVMILAAIYSFYRAYKQWVSGSQWYEGNELKTSDERVGFFTIGATWFGVIFLVFAAICYFWMKTEA